LILKKETEVVILTDVNFNDRFSVTLQNNKRK